MNARLLGFLCAVGALIGTADSIRLAVTGHTASQLSNFFILLWALGALCGLWGIFLLKVAGKTTLAKIAVVLPMIGFVVIAVQQLLWVINPKLTLPFDAGPIAVLGMLILGIFVIIAKRWEGWRRFSPLFHLAAIVISILPFLLKLPPMIGILVGLAWVFIGYAVQSTPASVVLPTASVTPLDPSRE